MIKTGAGGGVISHFYRHKNKKGMYPNVLRLWQKLISRITRRVDFSGDVFLQILPEDQITLV
jgi:hypothetical protein